MSYEQVCDALNRHGVQQGQRHRGQLVTVIGGVYADRRGQVKHTNTKSALVEIGPIHVWFPHHRLKAVLP